MKIISLLLLTTLLLFFGCTKTEHFSTKLMRPPADGIETPIDTQFLQVITKEPLQYIGNGLEAIAFATSDDRYVIKFFLEKSIIKKSWFKPKQRIRELLKKPEKLNFKSLLRYERAFLNLPDETGLIALHLRKSSTLLPSCKVIDYRNKTHIIDLNKVAFVVQKKATIIDKTKPPSLETEQKLYKLFTTLSNKGFVNLSPKFNPENFALYEGKAIMIDLGKLDFRPEIAYSLEEKNFHNRYQQWITRRVNRSSCHNRADY